MSGAKKACPADPTQAAMSAVLDYASKTLVGSRGEPVVFVGLVVATYDGFYCSSARDASFSVGDVLNDSLRAFTRDETRRIIELGYALPVRGDA